MENIKELKNNKEELLSALKEAVNLLKAHVQETNLDNPKYWKIQKVLQKNGVNQSAFENIF